MRKINVGIVGYGNLGKGVELALQNWKEFKLVKIFSNRDGLTSPFKTSFEKTKNLNKYVGQIDLMFLCGGSFNDIEILGPKVIENFNTVDSFDTHLKLEKYILNLDKLSKHNNKVAICAGGWDPGLMSMIRLVFNSISPNSNASNSFWGKGVSQGHSNAIRNVNGVKNAIQYTVPNKKVIRRCKKLFNFTPYERKKHKRLCYVVTTKNANKNKIKKQIINMPNYFSGYKTIVKFASEKKVTKLQQKMFHSGCVFKNFKCGNKYKTSLSFHLNTESNPHFTAEILISLAVAASKLSNEQKFGAYCVFDLPLSYLTFKNRDELLKTIL